MATVTIKHVTKAFGDNVVLKEFNDEIRRTLKAAAMPRHCQQARQTPCDSLPS